MAEEVIGSGVDSAFVIFLNELVVKLLSKYLYIKTILHP